MEICLHTKASVWSKTSLNTGGVGRAVAAPPTSKSGKFLSWPLALSKPIYSNFQINGASEETFLENYNFYCSKNGYKNLKSFSRSSIYLEIAISRHT